MALNKQQLNNFVTVGKVINFHGLRGEVKIDVYLENFKILQTIEVFFVGDSLTKTKIKFLKNSKGSIWLAAIAGCKNKEQAGGMKGQFIFLKKNILPTLITDEFYYADLKGLQINVEGSTQKGFVNNVNNFGSGDVLEVFLDGRKATIYIPFDKSNVSKVDLANGIITLTPLKGLLT